VKYLSRSTLSSRIRFTLKLEKGLNSVERTTLYARLVGSAAGGRF
jgi:hypothetical protein